jgi:sulfur-oxidizing protein SoxY
MRYRLALALALCCVPAVATPEDGADSEIWTKVRTDLFGTRAIADDESRVRLRLPPRAADAGAVPLEVEAPAGPGAAKKLYLIIEKNPSPIAAIVEFGDASGGALLETRVRVEDYTWVRAIVEMEDGSLAMSKRFIKAAGGCSAPAGKSLAERLQGMGEMKWRVENMSTPEGSSAVQLLVRHPNNSGLAMDQLTRLYEPPHYVRSVRVTLDGRLVLNADVDFSLSENPSLRFLVAGGKPGMLRADIVDSRDLQFDSTVSFPAVH